MGDKAQQSPADRIRHFVRSEHIVPARLLGRREIEVRSGDVHARMGLDNRKPNHRMTCLARRP